MTETLEGKCALVTGAAGVLGAAISASLVEAGLKVVMLDVAAERLREVALGLGPAVRPLALDISDAMTEPQSLAIRLADLRPVEMSVTGEPGEVRFDHDFRPQGVNARAEEVYREGTGGTAILAELRVTFFGDSQQREVTLAPQSVTVSPESGVAAPGTVMQVEVFGIAAQHLAPGADAVQLAGGEGRQVTLFFEADGRTLGVAQDESRFAATPGSRRRWRLARSSTSSRAGWPG